MASKTQSSPTSDFYYACRNGLIDKVREQLPTMSLEEINTIQGNGSTALHAACFYSHTDIVKLLLEKGASRSIQNNHNCLPYDEAQKEDIKKLFTRQSLNRFSGDGSGQIEWIICDAAAESLASDYRFRHSGFGWTSKNINHRMKYIKDEISHTDKECINIFLNQAQTNPHYLLKALTVESEFYKKLNKDLATKNFDQGTNFGITYFIDFFYNNPAFQDLSFKGKVYRGMTITDNELKQFSAGGRVINKAFMSTSKDRKLAEDFANKNNGEHVKLSVLCTYEILYDRTALNIEEISEYKYEREVLIGPYTAFVIKAIRRVTPTYVEIDLRECEKVNEEDDDFDD